jgi:hypothetical protein
MIIFAKESNDLVYNSKPVIISDIQLSRFGRFYKVGQMAGKTLNFFKKTETKTSAMISYWSLETVLFTLIILSSTNIYAVFAALFIYLYGTYVIFSAVNALTK